MNLYFIDMTLPVTSNSENNNRAESGAQAGVVGPDSWADSPLARLDPADRSLIVQFVLNSGSLKALAKEQGVSYPTIRNRLNTVIGCLRAIVDDRPIDPMARALAALVERGQISSKTARDLLEVSRRSRSGEITQQNGGSDAAVV